jgi:hypothetical protein
MTTPVLRHLARYALACVVVGMAFFIALEADQKQQYDDPELAEEMQYGNTRIDQAQSRDPDNDAAKHSPKDGWLTEPFGYFAEQFRGGEDDDQRQEERGDGHGTSSPARRPDCATFLREQHPAPSMDIKA